MRQRSSHHPDLRTILKLALGGGPVLILPTIEAHLIGSFAVGALRLSSGHFNPPRRLSLTLRYAYR